MADHDHQKRPDKKLNPFVRFGGMVFQMLTVILLAAWGGHWLDGYFETLKPYWTISCGFAGVILSMVLVILDAKRSE